MFERLQNLFGSKHESVEEGDALSAKRERDRRARQLKGVDEATAGVDALTERIDAVRAENEEEMRLSEERLEERDKKAGGEKRGLFSFLRKKGEGTAEWSAEKAREGAELTAQALRELRKNPELRKEIATKLETGVERWLSIKGAGDIVKAFAGKGDLASLVKGMFEKGGEVETTQEFVAKYAKAIDKHRKEFAGAIYKERFRSVLQLLGKSEEEIDALLARGRDQELYRQYQKELNEKGTYIVWERSADSSDLDKRAKTEAGIRAKHIAAHGGSANDVLVIFDSSGRGDMKELLWRMKENLKKEGFSAHTRIARGYEKTTQRDLAVIAARYMEELQGVYKNRNEAVADVMKAHSETTVNAWDETRDIVNTILTAVGRVELRAASGILTRMGKGAREAAKMERREEIASKFYHEVKSIKAHDERYGARISEIHELRARLSGGTTLENQEFLNEMMEFNRKYRREAQLSLDESAKPPFEEDKFVEFFKTSADIEKYLSHAEDQYRNTREKLRRAHKGILEGGGKELPEHGYLWYLKETVANKARDTVNNLKIWKNKSTLTQEQGIVRNIISTGQGFGDVFRFVRFGHDAQELSEDIARGEVFGQEGGFVEYLQAGGEKLASRFYEDELAAVMVARAMNDGGRDKMEAETLASLHAKLTGGDDLNAEEREYLEVFKREADELHHRELSGEKLSDTERGAIAEAKHAAAEEYSARGVLQKIATNLGKHNIERNVSTITELPARLERIVNIAERGSEGVVAHLDEMGSNIAKRAYGEDLTALLFQKEAVSETSAISEESRERIFQYFTGGIKREELGQEDEEHLQKIEHEAAELGSKHRSGGELADDEAALIVAAENKALIDYLDEGVLEKIANSAGRIREYLQGIPDPAVREEAETQLALIETDPKKFAEGLRICGAGMLGGGGFASAYEKARAKRKGWRDEQGLSKLHALVGISGLAILGTLAMLAYREWGIETNEIKTENDTLLRTKTSDGSKIVNIEWHASEKEKELPTGKIAEKEAFVPKKFTQKQYKATSGFSVCDVKVNKKDKGFTFAFDINYDYGSFKNVSELGMIMMESAFDSDTKLPFTVIKTGVGEVKIPIAGDKCFFSPQSTETTPILVIEMGTKRIHVEFDTSDPGKVSLVMDYTDANSPKIVANNVPVADLAKYFDAEGNFIAEPEKAVSPVPETSQPKPEEPPEEKPKYAKGEIPPPTGEPVSLADALIMYSHVDSAVQAEIEAQIARYFIGPNAGQADYHATVDFSFPDAVRNMLVTAAKADAEIAHIKNAQGKTARAELERITNMIPRLQKALKGEGLALEKVKDDLGKVQNMEELEKFIAGHEQKAREIAAERAMADAERKAKEKAARAPSPIAQPRGERVETRASYKALLSKGIAKHHPALRGEFMKGIDQPGKARDFQTALNEFGDVSKSVFTPEQAADLLSQLESKTTDELHTLAIRVGELASFENMLNGIQQSVVLPERSLHVPISESAESLRARVLALDAALQAIQKKNPFVTFEGKERVLDMKEGVYTQPLMREYAERVYQKSEEVEKEMQDQRREIEELLKRVATASKEETAIPPAPPAPDGAPKMLSEADFVNETQQSKEFISNLKDVFNKSGTTTIDSRHLP